MGTDEKGGSACLSSHVIELIVDKPRIVVFESRGHCPRSRGKIE